MAEGKQVPQGDQMMTGAMILLESLQKVGVDTVFGLPGGAVLPLYDPLFDSPIRHVLVRHEQAGGHSAEGYALATGRVGVCLATSGPGQPIWSHPSWTPILTRFRWSSSRVR